MEDNTATATAETPAETSTPTHTPVAAAALLLVYDTETTGKPDWKAPSELPTQPHIVELYAELVDPLTREVVSSMYALIKPDGWEIPMEATNIHGVTTERALAEGIPIKDAMDQLLAMVDQAAEVVGHNEQFDRRMVRIALKRNNDLLVPEGGAIPSEKWKALKGFCTCWKGRAHTKLPKNKLPTLGEAFLHFFGVPMDDAHSARGDVTACKAVYFAIKDAEAKTAPVRSKTGIQTESDTVPM